MDIFSVPPIPANAEEYPGWFADHLLPAWDYLASEWVGEVGAEKQVLFGKLATIAATMVICATKEAITPVQNASILVGLFNAVYHIGLEDGRYD